jgi:hypothetical protein
MNGGLPGGCLFQRLSGDLIRRAQAQAQARAQARGRAGQAGQDGAADVTGQVVRWGGSGENRGRLGSEPVAGSA